MGITPTTAKTPSSKSSLLCGAARCECKKRIEKENAKKKAQLRPRVPRPVIKTPPAARPQVRAFPPEELLVKKIGIPPSAAGGERRESSRLPGPPSAQAEAEGAGASPPSPQPPAWVSWASPQSSHEAAARRRFRRRVPPAGESIGRELHF